MGSGSYCSKHCGKHSVKHSSKHSDFHCENNCGNDCNYHLLEIFWIFMKLPDFYMSFKYPVADGYTFSKAKHLLLMPLHHKIKMLLINLSRFTQIHNLRTISLFFTLIYEW